MMKNKWLRLSLRLAGTFFAIGILAFLYIFSINFIDKAANGGFSFYVENNKLIINNNGNINTYVFKETKDTILENEDNIKIREKSSYYELSNNERVVYKNVLSRAKSILNKETNSTEITISLKDMYINLDNCNDYNEIKKKVNDTISNIDYEKIYRSLHIDYGYLFWWEYDMKWEVIEADIRTKNKNVSESTFALSLTPYDEYKESEHTIKTNNINIANNAYQKAINVAQKVRDESTFEKLKFFKEWIIENVDYDYTSAELVNQDRKNIRVVKASSFTNILDENSNTNAICSGYAEAFQLLCDLSGIECYKTNGVVSSSTNKYRHAWNIVIINNERYLSDITNSETGAIGQGGELFLTKIGNNHSYSISIDKYNSVNYIED